MKKLLLATFFLLASLGAAFAQAGCSVLGGWPGAQYGLQAQILTDSLPCYGITGTKNSPVVLQGAPNITAPMTITGASAVALAVGRLGVTTPSFTVDTTSGGTTINGISIIGGATGNGVNITAIGGDTDVPVIFNAAHAGTINFGSASTGVINLFRNTFINHDSSPTLTLGSAGGSQAAIATPGSVGLAINTGTGPVVASAAVTSKGATQGVGYSTGAGGTVTQITSRTTGVTLNKVSGQITMFSAAGSATAATFTVTNSAIASTDVIHLVQASGTNLYNFIVTAVASGSFNVTFFTTGGVATDAPVINFAVIKAVAS